MGRKLCFGSFHETEIGNRVSSGWGAFMKYKSELCNKHGSLRNRMRLFDAVVTPRVIYGCAAWTLKEADKKRLRTCRRHMLRMMFAPRRRVIDTPEELSQSEEDSGDDSCNEEAGEDEEDTLEPWAEFIQRVTHNIEAQLENVSSEDWVTTHRKAKMEVCRSHRNCYRSEVV